MKAAQQHQNSPESGAAQAVPDEPAIYQIPPELGGKRLDAALAILLPQYSRSRIQQWIKDGSVTLAGRKARARDPVAEGQNVEVRLPDATLADGTPPQAQDIALDILHEDESVIVVNKPAGLVVHPGAGTPDGTLQNALLYHAPELTRVPRAGLVHRLDKDTSGVMVIARSDAAHRHLTLQIANRLAAREYLALVHGVVISGATIDKPLGRHPSDRKRMAAVSRGRRAVTHYRVGARYRRHSQLKVRLETGRTHQIRVHLAHVGFPVVGDPVYGGRRRNPSACTEELRQRLANFRRQALHAWRLTLTHPESETQITWQAPVPADFELLQNAMVTDVLDGTA